MDQTMRALISFLQQEDGPTATEYAVMVGLGIVALMGALQMLSGSLDNMLSSAASIINDAATK